MKFYKKSLIILFLFIFYSITSLFSQNKKISTFRIQNPQLLATSSLEINTDWDFFWGKFVIPYDTSIKPDLQVSAPSDWNKYPLSEDIKKIAASGKGSGTYRLKLTNLKPGQKYVFPVYKLAYTAFTIYADNTLIFQSGSPSEEWENTLSMQFFDTAAFTADDTGSVLLSIYVSNNFYRKGGLRGKLTLYEEALYQNEYFKNLFTHSIFTGILIIISLYCFINFLFKKEKLSLFLSLLILTIYTRLGFSSFPILKIFLPNFPFSVLLKLEYISVFFIPGFLTLYIDSLNKKIFMKIPAMLIAFPSFIFFILDIVLPINIANRIVPAMQVYMYTVIVIDTILFVISIFRDKDFVTTLSIISLLLISIGATFDILLIHHISFLKGINFLTLSFFQFAIIQIIIIASIQNKNYMKILELNNYLHETNIAYYRFVPKEFLSLLCKKDITEITLGEYKISRAAILSADIRNFTSTSEKLVPIQVFDMLNTYLRRIAPLIRKYNGIIEKYLGDGIIAIFPDNAEAALNCAIEMQEQMIELRSEFAQRGMPQITIGIGIHYGDIIIGTSGNNDRMTEISLSKNIDIAIKTESKTKQYHKPILVTYDAISQAAKEARKHGRKFSFSGLKIKDSPSAIIFSIFNEKFENYL